MFIGHEFFWVAVRVYFGLNQMSKSHLSSHRVPRLWCSAVLGDFRSQMRVAPL